MAPIRCLKEISVADIEDLETLAVGMVVHHSAFRCDIV